MASCPRHADSAVRAGADALQRIEAALEPGSLSHAIIELAKLILQGRFGPKDVIPVNVEGGEFVFHRTVH